MNTVQNKIDEPVESPRDYRLEVLFFHEPLHQPESNERQLTKLWRDTAHD